MATTEKEPPMEALVRIESELREGWAEECRWFLQLLEEGKYQEATEKLAAAANKKSRISVEEVLRLLDVEPEQLKEKAAKAVALKALTREWQGQMSLFENDTQIIAGLRRLTPL